MTQCKCELAGWCETHKRRMSETRYRECKEKPGYFEVFEKDRIKRETDGKIGLGDIIDNITTATGIKYLVNKVTGGNCGCDERKEKLNNIRI